MKGLFLGFIYVIAVDQPPPGAVTQPLRASAQEPKPRRPGLCIAHARLGAPGSAEAGSVAQARLAESLGRALSETATQAPGEPQKSYSLKL